MVSALHGIFEAQMPVDISDEWRTFVDALALEDDLRGRSDRSRSGRRRYRASGCYRSAVRPIRACHHSYDGLTQPGPAPAPSRMSSPTRPKPMSTSGRCRAWTGRFVDSHLYKAMGSARDEIDITPFMDVESTISPTGNRLWEAIEVSVEELDGHRNLLPTLMNVGTDARFWRPKGTVAYGVGPVRRKNDLLRDARSLPRPR